MVDTPFFSSDTNSTPSYSTVGCCLGLDYIFLVMLLCFLRYEILWQMLASQTKLTIELLFPILSNLRVILS